MRELHRRVLTGGAPPATAELAGTFLDTTALTVLITAHRTANGIGRSFIDASTCTGGAVYG